MPDDDLVTTEGVDEAPEPTDARDPAGPGGKLPEAPPASPVPAGTPEPGPGQQLEEGEG